MASPILEASILPQLRPFATQLFRQFPIFAHTHPTFTSKTIIAATIHTPKWRTYRKITCESTQITLQYITAEQHKALVTANPSGLNCAESMKEAEMCSVKSPLLRS